MKPWTFSKRVKLVAAGFAVGILVLGALDQPAPYFGSAAFAIDWDHSPTLSLDEKNPDALQQKVRKEVFQTLTGSWPSSEQIPLLETASRFPAAGLRAPEVAVEDKSDTLSVVSIEIPSDTPEAAQAMAEVTLNGARRLASNRLRMRGAEASLESWSKAENIKANQDQLRKEMAAIYQNPPISAEGQARLNEIRIALDKLEWGQAENGLAILFNGSKSLFGPELPVIKSPQVEASPRGEYWMGVLFTALLAAVMAGGAARFLEGRKKTIAAPPPPSTPPPLPPLSPPTLPPRLP